MENMYQGIFSPFQRKSTVCHRAYSFTPSEQSRTKATKKQSVQSIVPWVTEVDRGAFE
jgi:hypothetical protein